MIFCGLVLVIVRHVSFELDGEMAQGAGPFRLPASAGRCSVSDLIAKKRRPLRGRRLWETVDRICN